MNDIQLQQIERKIEERKRILPNFANNFLTSLDFDKRPQTQLEYAKDIQLFFEYLVEEQVVKKESIQDLTLDDMKKVTEEDIRLFFDYLTKYKKEFITVGGNKTVQEFTNGPRGKERKRVSVHALYNYFLERNMVDKNPVHKIRIKVQKYTIKPRLTDKELLRMFDIALNNNPNEYRAFRNYIILKILAYTGIRISELTNMNISDVWQNRNEFIVIRKGGEEESIYINVNIRDDFYRYVKMRKRIKNVQKGHQDALFLSQRMRRIDPRSVRKMMRKVAAEADVDTHVTPHTFRRTFGWKHFNKFEDLELTAEVLGHSSSEITRQIYANADREHKHQPLDVFSYGK